MGKIRLSGIIGAQLVFCYGNCSCYLTEFSATWQHGFVKTLREYFCVFSFVSTIVDKMVHSTVTPAAPKYSLQKCIFLCSL